MIGMLLEFLNDFIDFRNYDKYENNEPRDIEDTNKIHALECYEAEERIKNETDPNKKRKMQYLFNMGVTDFSGI